MKIKVDLSRDENIKHYGSDLVEIDMDEYIWGVCASECGGSPLEAQKALAVAARTNAYEYAQKDKPISDLSTRAQAFRASRLTDAYRISRQAALETSGLVLYCNGKLANPASYSSNNGGRTRSSKDRWGSYRSWLIEQDDPWDNATNVTGHRCGMSQLGARNAAQLGKTYLDILSFYYPTTYLHNIDTGEDIQLERKDEDSEKGKEEKDMADAKASDLIQKFKQMVDEHWKYVANAARVGEVDCSGAFTLFYRQLGSAMVHGSNTMYRKWTVEAGKKGSIQLVPGMAVFCHHFDGNEPTQYRNDGIGNFSHVGCYVGGGLVAEAKGEKSGCVYSSINDAKWTHVARLKNTEYDVDTEPSTLFVPFKGKVTTKSGDLNFRGTPNGAKIGLIPRDTMLTILGESGDWYKTTYLNKTGWVSRNYITRINDDKKFYSVTITGVSEDYLNTLKEYLTEARLAFKVEEGAST